MAIYYLSDALRWAAERAGIERPSMRLRSHERAIELLERSVLGDLSLSAIQGPPGTGKTSVVEGFAERRLDELMDGEGLLIYVAPTNHLVFEAFRRMARILMRHGYSARDILDYVRVYGSKIYPARRDERVEVGGDVLSYGDLRELTGWLDPDRVKLVFATEFQRVLAKARGGEGPVQVHIVADEASKTPFFRVFLSVTDRVVREPEDYPVSLTVLGDPQQAITVPEAMKAYRVPLLMKHVERVLEEHGMKDECFQMLDTTFRLPSPSEEPISHGYYGDALHALYRAEDRLKAVEEAFIDHRSAVERSLSRVNIDAQQRDVRAVLDGIEEALSASSPVLIIRARQFTPGDTYEPRRVWCALVLSATLQEASRLSGIGFSTVVTAPYSDLVTSFSLRYRRLGGPLARRPPLAVTVQSLVGGEGDVVVAMMGKEWGARAVSYYSPRYALYAEDQETLYFREPEVFNVQSSRHRCLYALIGDVYRLARESQADQRLRRAASKLVEMADSGEFVSVDLTGGATP